MNIVVTVKQVPDTTEIKIDPVKHTLIRDGVPSIMNPDDKAALEEALVLKDRYGASVTVVCMGPMQAEKVLREALSMGADRAVLLTDRAFAGSDTLATSRIIAAAIDKIGYDLILSGRQAIDGDTAQVGPQIAELLDIPQVTYVENIRYDNKGKLTLKRKFETYVQEIETEGKALLTVLSGTNKPRYMNVKHIVAQADRPIEIITFDDLALNKEEIGLNGSPTRVKSTFTKQVQGGGEKIEADGKEAAAIIAQKLREKSII